MPGETPYEIDKSKQAWAERRVFVLRRSIGETHEALTALKKAAAAMKKAAEGCKACPETSVMKSFEGSIRRVIEDLDEFCKDWESDANAIQLGIINYRMKEGNANE